MCQSEFAGSPVFRPGKARPIADVGLPAKSGRAVIAGLRLKAVASAGINVNAESIMDQRQYVGLDVSPETTAV